MTIWVIPTFFLEIYGDAIGSYCSYAMFILLIIYYSLITKGKVIMPFLILGLSYFLISGVVFTPDFEDLIYKLLKYLVFIIAGAEVVKRTTKNELMVFLLIGAISVIINAWFFQDDYGRYGGFYLNPNSAGVLALIGYSLSFTIDKKLMKYIGFFVFSLAGIITLSRYFLFMWVILSFASLYYNRKNAVVFGIGFGTLLLLLSISTLLQLNSMRFSVIESILENQISQGLVFINENSRFDSWSEYYNMILEKPFFGNGYRELEGVHEVKSGVHNTFLLTLGEAGLLPFIILIIIYTRMCVKSIVLSKTLPYLLLVVLSIIGYMFVSHNYYDNYLILFISIWAFIKLKNETLDLVELAPEVNTLTN